MDISRLIVLLIVGGLAGTVAGWLVTRKKEGLGRWTNLGVGLVGAVIGGFLFEALHIDLGLGEIKVTFEDLVAAVCGSLLFVAALAAGRRYLGRKKKTQP
ncbi:MAG: GlsB/YeaQ/YmgE family stress response membrane protein [Pirellulales bacterium]|nr:GlsB/YeaQ/YmgE family stress response membrane protein [Pirellulales bacterium]